MTSVRLNSLLWPFEMHMKFPHTISYFSAHFCWLYVQQCCALFVSCHGWSPWDATFVPSWRPGTRSIVQVPCLCQCREVQTASRTPAGRDTTVLSCLQIHVRIITASTVVVYLLWLHCIVLYYTVRVDRKNLSPFDLYCVGGTLSLTRSVDHRSRTRMTIYGQCWGQVKSAHCTSPLMYATYVFVWVMCSSLYYSNTHVSLLGEPGAVCLQYATWQPVTSSTGLCAICLDSLGEIIAVICVNFVKCLGDWKHWCHLGLKPGFSWKLG